jgi:NTE family protein
MATAPLHHPREHLRTPDASRPRTAFVLSGGASLGAPQVGMLEALHERDIVPDMPVGSSAGAPNAAFVASRPQTTATARALGRIWRNLQREDIFPVSMSALVGGLCGRRDHLVPDRGLRRLARRCIEFDDLADAPIPLHLVAFDLVEGRELSLSEGPAVDSVVAASSIPGVFAPVAMGDRRLIDGGVVNNTPISHAVELGAERIYVLPTQDPSYRQLDRAPKSALDAAIYGVRVRRQPA